MMRALCTAALCAVVAVPASASAQPTSTQEYESPRNWVFELHGTKVKPEIDDDPTLTGDPYRDAFGTKKLWVFGGELDFHLVYLLGPLSVGLAADYGTVYGRGIVARTGEQSADVTSLKTVPLRALAVYRFDWAAREVGIPFIPYAKAGLAHTIWWITNGRGDVARFGDAGKAFGGKWGYQLTAGLAFELNFIDSTLGREFDQDWGVNSSFIFGEYTRVTADNFGGSGLDLSSGSWTFGLGFEF